MKAYLQAFGLWDVMEEGYEVEELRANATQAQRLAHETEIAKGFKALTALHSSVSDSIFTRIMSCTSAREVWLKLQEEFQGNTRTRQMQVLNLRREFETIRMKENELVKDFTDRLLKVVNQIRVLGEPLTDQRVVEKVLVSLPEKFEAKISSLEESRNLSEITLSELINALQATEQRRAIRKEESLESAFMSSQSKKNKKNKNKNKGGTGYGGFNNNNNNNNFNNNNNNARQQQGGQRQNNGGYPPCPHCKKHGHAPNKCFWRPDVTCDKCGQRGHVGKVCKQGRQQANVVNEEAETLFVATCLKATSSGFGWLVDSGCSHHMTFEETNFVELDRSYKTRVKIGNGSFMDVEGKGDISLSTNKGTKIIQNVLYVPSLCENLLSVAQLVEKGYVLNFGCDGCLILDAFGNELFKVALKDKSYRLNLLDSEQALKGKVESISQLWHKRLGHSSYGAMKNTNALVNDMPLIDDVKNVCEVCQLGKSTRLPFPKIGAWRAKEKLELVHSDVCGPMSVSSLSGCRYFLTFIDDYSRMCWVYFLTHKSQVLKKFMEFKKMVENQSRSTLKCLRTDNGGEYTSLALEDFCKESGIIHQFTTPYTPQQNGVCERKNRTLMEMARCMIHEKNMPKKFWAEAIYTSSYIQNRCFTKSIEDKTPYELWFGEKPSLENFKVFGSVCFLHVHSHMRDKLDKKANVGVLVGYSEVTKGFRVYNLETKKLMVTRDVKIDENAKWDWSKEELLVNEDEPQLEEERNVESNNDEDDNDEDNEEDDDLLQETIGAELEVGNGVRGERSLSEIYERCNVALGDPTCVQEALMKKEWKKAMDVEMEMIEKNETWSLVTKPKNKKAIGVKWIFRTKYNPDGTICKHKARLVVKGYAQQAGVDYGETFAPVARMETIRLILALSATKQWSVFHLDVKSAFLNGVLQEEVYVKQPEGYVIEGHEDKVYKLHKALYGLKQAPRAWYERIDGYLLGHGFRRSQNEPTLYVRVEGSMIVVSLYVDDLLVTGEDPRNVDKLRHELEKEFEMSSLGLMNYFLGVEVIQCQRGIFISQEKYIKDLLKKFNLEECNPMSTPMIQGEKYQKEDGTPKVNPTLYRSLIGSLLYVCSSRPDIMYAVCVLSRYMQAPTQTHLKGAKRVLRYLKGTSDYGVWYEAKDELKLVGYSDSDWAGCIDDMRSTSGYLFSLGSGPFSWNSKKQSTTAQSTAEAEYIACSSCANQCIWLRKLMGDLGHAQEGPTIIKCDNTSAISIAKNPVQHGRTKHIPVKYHSLREFEDLGEVSLEYVNSEENLADAFTKPLGKTRFEALRTFLNVSSKITKEEC